MPWLPDQMMMLMCVEGAQMLASGSVTAVTYRV